MSKRWMFALAASGVLMTSPTVQAQEEVPNVDPAAVPNVEPEADTPQAAQRERPYPLMREFIGLNGHTFQLDAKLYAPVAGAARDYHNVSWDLAGDPTNEPPEWPASRVDLPVNWKSIYGSWQENGFWVHVALQFTNMPEEVWTDLEAQASRYARSFAEYFGPGGEGLVDSVQIGNEPGFYSDPFYRRLFESMATAIREADPELKIVTAASTPGFSYRWAKSLDTVLWLEDLYDVIAIHMYAHRTDTPNRRRTWPEDERADFLSRVRETRAWRDHYVPDKELWVTEFGWDSSTKLADEGNWEGVTDLQQAQYLVRTFLVLPEMGVDKAFMYFFADRDSPGNHASAGLVRNDELKPSYFAQKHLYQTLGDYRFSHVIEKVEDDLCVYAFEHAEQPGRGIWVAWFPTGTSRVAARTLPAVSGEVVRAERMATTADGGESVEVRVLEDGRIRVPVSESPVYIWIEGK